MNESGLYRKSHSNLFGFTPFCELIVIRLKIRIHDIVAPLASNI